MKSVKYIAFLFGILLLSACGLAPKSAVHNTNLKASKNSVIVIGKIEVSPKIVDVKRTKSTYADFVGVGKYINKPIIYINSKREVRNPEVSLAGALTKRARFIEAEWGKTFSVSLPAQKTYVNWVSMYLPSYSAPGAPISIHFPGGYVAFTKQQKPS